MEKELEQQGSSGENRASLELSPLSKTQDNRINAVLERMLKATGQKACQNHGISKHETKAENRKAGNPYALSNVSESTEDAYKSGMKGLMHWAYQSYGIKDPFQITSTHIKEFGLHLVNCGFSKNGFSGYCKAISYYAKVMTKYDHDPKWQEALKEIRNYKGLCVDKEHARAYANPNAIIGALEGKAAIAAELQYKCGLRIADACFIRGKHWDPVKGEGVVNSKNGQEIHFRPPLELVQKLTDIIRVEGKFALNLHTYNDALKSAVTKTGQVWQSSHGLRHNAAIDYMRACEAKGMTYQQALRATGEMLGHHRSCEDVTKTYTDGLAAW